MCFEKGIMKYVIISLILLNIAPHLTACDNQKKTSKITIEQVRHDVLTKLSTRKMPSSDSLEGFIASYKGTLNSTRIDSLNELIAQLDYQDEASQKKLEQEIQKIVVGIATEKFTEFQKSKKLKEKLV